MIEVIVLNIIWLGVLFFMDRENKKERQKLIDRIMAKSLQEVKEVEAKPVVDKPEIEVNPDYIPIEEADDETFDRVIRKQLGRETIQDKVKSRIRKARRK